MEQLINVINGIVKANSGKSLHLETQQTNEANDMKQSIGETSKTNSNEADATRILNLCIYFLFSHYFISCFFYKRRIPIKQ
nr:hypothetical protein [Helicobacter pylori]